MFLFQVGRSSCNPPDGNDTRILATGGSRFLNGRYTYDTDKLSLSNKACVKEEVEVLFQLLLLLFFFVLFFSSRDGLCLDSGWYVAFFYLFLSVLKCVIFFFLVCFGYLFRYTICIVLELHLYGFCIVVLLYLHCFVMYV